MSEKEPVWPNHRRINPVSKSVEWCDCTACKAWGNWATRLEKKSRSQQRSMMDYIIATKREDKSDTINRSNN